MWESQEGRGFFFGVLYKLSKPELITDEGRHQFRGWFYYINPNKLLTYDKHPKSGKTSYKNYFVSTKESLKNHKFLKYKEFRNLEILFGPEIKKAAPNAGEEIPTPEAT
jgi:hypothetical protein